MLIEAESQEQGEQGGQRARQKQEPFGSEALQDVSRYGLSSQQRTDLREYAGRKVEWNANRHHKQCDQLRVAPKYGAENLG